jgi:DNA-directed RNA polymerase specialized sigma24 family protein
MGTARKLMGDEGGRDGVGVEAKALGAHGATIAKFAMALMGEAREVERVLEQVARERAQKKPPEGVRELVWLLGLARAACATQLSKIPLRHDGPRTERLATDASSARTHLAALKPTEREAVALHLVGGLDAKEVAAACGIDVSHAKTRIERGIAQLMEKKS